MSSSPLAASSSWTLQCGYRNQNMITLLPIKFVLHSQWIIHFNKKGARFWTFPGQSNHTHNHESAHTGPLYSLITVLTRCTPYRIGSYARRCRPGRASQQAPRTVPAWLNGGQIGDLTGWTATVIWERLAWIQVWECKALGKNARKLLVLREWSECSVLNQKNASIIKVKTRMQSG